MPSGGSTGGGGGGGSRGGGGRRRVWFGWGPTLSGGPPEVTEPPGPPRMNRSSARSALRPAFAPAFLAVPPASEPA